MKRTPSWMALFLVALVLFCCAEPALASPGGKIVVALFTSTWGKILMCILAILFFPLIVWIAIQQKRTERKMLKLLRSMAAANPAFEWFSLRERIIECFHRVHGAWRVEDMSEAAAWMTSWYWQNQQLAYLNQWARDGLFNHCRIKTISYIYPLFLQYKSNDDGSAEGTRLMVSISALMEDYLEHRATGKIVEGQKGFVAAEHVWTFILQNGRWVVANIEDASASATYAGMLAEAPEIQSARPAPGALKLNAN